jgi:hypothetical protein
MAYKLFFAKGSTALIVEEEYFSSSEAFFSLKDPKKRITLKTFYKPEGQWFIVLYKKYGVNSRDN